MWIQMQPYMCVYNFFNIICQSYEREKSTFLFKNLINKNTPAVLMLSIIMFQVKDTICVMVTLMIIVAGRDFFRLQG